VVPAAEEVQEEVRVPEDLVETEPMEDAEEVLYLLSAPVP
jgi:hypothetical protein